MQPTVFGQSTRLLASWTSAVVIQLVTFSGLIVHFIISGQEISAVALLVGAMFIPALAIFLGRLSSTSRTFEFIYMLVWYMGPIDQNRGMDFLGTTINTAPTPISSFAIISVLLLIMGLSMDKLGTQIRRVRQFG